MKVWLHVSFFFSYFSGSVALIQQKPGPAYMQHGQPFKLSTKSSSFYSNGSSNASLPPGYARITPEWRKAISTIKSRMDEERKRGFPNKPIPEQFERVFQNSIEKARADPCKAEILSGFQRGGLGYGFNVINFLDTLTAGLYFNKSIALCTSDYEKKFWRSLFEDSYQLPVCADEDACHWNGEAYIGKDMTEGLLKHDEQYLLSLKNFLYSKYYTFKPDVEKLLSERLATMGIEKTTKYVGVHIRRGDKIRQNWGISPEAEKTETSVYGEKVMEVLKPEHKAIYLASDDKNAKSELEDYLMKNNVKLPVVTTFDKHADDAYKKGWNAEKFSRPTNQDSLDESLVVLAQDIFALNHADIFIGTSSSNMDIATYYARPDTDSLVPRTIFVDNPFEYGIRH